MTRRQLSSTLCCKWRISQLCKDVQAREANARMVLSSPFPSKTSDVSATRRLALACDWARSRDWAFGAYGRFVEGLRVLGAPAARRLCFLIRTWRFMGSYKYSYKSPNVGYNYSYLTYNPTYNYP